ncbi:MAG: 50S ribosomal protein L4 [Candidatus Amoebophilus sp.]
MELSVLQYTGKDTGRKVVLSDTVFGITPNDHAVYLDVKNILANKRQGTHKSKERGEIAGSTRKIKKQKGTGTARAGSIKSPIFRGGGRVFGPKPRDYGFKLNKKLKKLARKSALTYKAQQGNISVLEDFSFEIPKTKMYLEMLQNLNMADQKTLLILPAVDKNLVLASRNLPNTSVALVEQINTYDLLYSKKILISETALSKLTENFNNA